MRLISIQINDPKGFRSLAHGFTINLNHPREDFHPHVVIGPNASGKSNLLELVANIFYHTECLVMENLPDNFVYDPKRDPDPQAFKLVYEVMRDREIVQVIISKESGAEIQIRRGDMESKPVSGEDARSLLPNHIVAYSTGANEILSLPFLKTRFLLYDAFIGDLLTYGSADRLPMSRLLYLNTEYSQAILIANLLIQECDALSLFERTIGLRAVSSIEIVLKDRIVLTDEQLSQFKAQLENSNIAESDYFAVVKNEFDEERTAFNILQAFAPILDMLKKCATCHYYDKEHNEWYLDFCVNESTRLAFQHHFHNAKTLFELFQLLLALNLYTTPERVKRELYESKSLYANETVPTPASDQRIIRFKEIRVSFSNGENEYLVKSLSDGEHQFLHTLGLCMLFNREDCLFLFDEPDTHFNPQWRSQFISTIRECGMENHDMIITTHTPYMVSDSLPDYVYLFERGTRKPTNPQYNTFGASVNQITLKSFGKRETIGDYAGLKYDGFLERYKKGEPIAQIVQEVEETFGDSVEKVLFLGQLRAKEES